MYALIVKNEKGLWDVWNTMSKIPMPEKENRLQAAIKSGLPIVGKNVTEHKTSVKSGSVWDGEKFSGGSMQKIITEDSNLAVYAYMCNDTVVLLQFAELDTDYHKYVDAIFNSETTIVNIPEDQTARVGDVWDGERIVGSAENE